MSIRYEQSLNCNLDHWSYRMLITMRGMLNSSSKWFLDRHLESKKYYKMLSRRLRKDHLIWWYHDAWSIRARAALRATRIVSQDDPWKWFSKSIVRSISWCDLEIISRSCGGHTELRSDNLWRCQSELMSIRIVAQDELQDNVSRSSWADFKTLLWAASCYLKLPSWMTSWIQRT